MTSQPNVITSKPSPNNLPIIKVIKTDAGDFRVNHPTNRKADYFAGDLEDAIDTARAMMRELGYKECLVKFKNKLY